MAKRRGTVVDDRGKRVEVVRSADVLEDPELFDVLRRVTETTSGLNQPVRLGHLIVLGLVVVGGVGMVVVMANAPGIAPWMPLLGMGVFVALGSYLSQGMWEAPIVHRRMESVLRIGRCAGCGYRLESLPPEPDGVVLCPECGAAWKCERVHFATLPVADLPVRPETAGDTPPLASAWMRGWVRAPSLVDDRDRSVPMVDLRLLGLETPDDPGRAERIRAQVRREGEAKRMGCAAVAGLGIVAFLASQVVQFASMGLAALRVFPLVMMVLVVPGWSMAVWRIWSGRTWVGQKAMVEYLKGCRVCPSCGQDVRGVERAADGCVACPRCAAAWKMRGEAGT